MLGVIGQADIDRAWPLCEPMLEKAMKGCAGDYSMEDIKKGLTEGRYLLWAWAEDMKIICCAITCFAFYPQQKILCLMMIGGKGWKLWREEAQEFMADWAKKNGCHEMEGYDTRCWLRILPKWRFCWKVIRRKL